MKNKLSVVLITKNAEGTLSQTLKSVYGWADEIVIVDDYSIDYTLEIASDYDAHIYFHHERDLGKRKKFAVEQAQNPWILILDSDEVVSADLKKEIIQTLKSPNPDSFAYKIPFQNHFLGKKVRYGGENYAMLRFFKKEAVIIQPALVHEEFKTKSNKVGEMKGKIYHYSYRSFGQLFTKFTGYAFREARQKAEKNERVTMKHLTMYPAHMFWSRFVEDSGYKDGLFRIPLDIAFAYMEFMTYFFLIFLKLFGSRRRHIEALR